MAKQARTEKRKGQKRCPYCSLWVKEGTEHLCDGKAAALKREDATEVELDGFQAYALAEHSKLAEQLKAEMQQVDRRLDQLAHEVLQEAGVNYSDLKNWTFHIDAKGKRVVLRKAPPLHPAKEKLSKMDRKEPADA